MFQLRAGEPAGAAVRRIGLEQIEATIVLLTTLSPDIDTAVHQARKNCKRLRALLRLIRSEIGAAAYHDENERIRDASRKLAPLRDSAVLTLALDGLVATADIPPPSVGAVRAELETERLRLRADFLRERAAIDAIIATFQEFDRRWRALPLDGHDFSVFAGGLARVYRQGQAAMRRAFDSDHSAEMYHEWRKQVKYLWHQTELLQPIWPDVLGAWERELHQISDYLGDGHDLFELELTVSGRGPTHFGNLDGASDLIPLLDRRRRQLELAAQPHGRRLYCEQAGPFTGRIGAYFQEWQANGINGVAEPEVFIDTKTAAALLELSVAQVRRKLVAGELPGVKMGRIWLVLNPDRAPAIASDSFAETNG